jgi:dTDP-4-dehydrorhamnose reductase
MAIEVARHLSLDEQLIEPVTEETFQQPARRPLITGFDITKAEEELGYNPTSFDEALKKTFE